MISKFNKLYHLVMEELEQDIDPELDERKIEFSNMTLAIVPGSFKPPHRGHWEMIMSYVDKVDKVIVLISNISKMAISSRPLSKSNLNGFGKLKALIDKIDARTGVTSEVGVKLAELAEKADNLPYDELKEGLEEVLDSDVLKAREYADVAKAIEKYIDRMEVDLFKSIRKTSTGKEITPEMSKEIFEIFARAYGVENKVDVRVALSASPITATFGLVENACKNCKILLGVSKKGGDEARWNGLKQSEKNPTNEIIASPVEVQTMLSATTLRENIDDLKKEWFPEKISDEDFEEIKRILG